MKVRLGDGVLTASSREDSNGLPEPIYDVFLSFSGTDREPCRELTAELRALGLRVFLDEDEIKPFAGITDAIREALRTAKTLVAYYSADYATRSACQRELMTAFLAGQREGNPCGRIMVINPEPGTDHLRPVQLADAKFALPAAGVAELARQIMKRSAEVERSIGEVPPVVRPRWSAQRLGHVRNFTGRYRELWDLHTALHAIDYPLIQETACETFASVCGLPGSGKTALVTAYAWRFAAAYPGGIHWVSLACADSGADALRARYVCELRRIAPELGVDLASVPDNRVVESVARVLRDSGFNSLWVIDDVPDGVDAAVLDFLLLPADSGARTVLIGDEDVFDDLLPVVRVGPLSMLDATVLLDGYRLPDGVADRQARDDVVLGLGGNAAALVAVGEYIRDRHGLSSYLSFAAEVDAVGHVADAVFAGVRRLLDRMSPDELILIRLADRIGTGVFPAGFLAALPGLVAINVGAALKRLLSRSAASRVGAVWRLDPLVARAARDHPRLRGMPETPEGHRRPRST
jgi:TIR domain